MVFFRDFNFVIKIDHLESRNLSCDLSGCTAWSGLNTVLVVLLRSSAGIEIFGEDIIHLNDSEGNDEV